MGYYVSSFGQVHIRAEDRARVNELLQNENKNPTTRKRGGEFSGTKQTAAWFSWMPEDWSHLNEREILEYMGFVVEEDEDLNLTFGAYDDKMGQEGHLLKVIAKYLDGALQWEGSDGAKWTLTFVLGEEMKKS